MDHTLRSRFDECFKELSQKVAEDQAKKTELQKELEALRQQSIVKTSTIKKLQIDLGNKIDFLQETNNGLKSQVEELEMLKKQLREQMYENKKLRDQLDGANQKIKDRERDIEVLQKARDYFHKELSIAKNTIDTLKSESAVIDQLRKEKSSLQQDLSQVKTRLKTEEENSRKYFVLLERYRREVMILKSETMIQLADRLSATDFQALLKHYVDKNKSALTLIRNTLGLKMEMIKCDKKIVPLVVGMYCAIVLTGDYPMTKKDIAEDLKNIDCDPLPEYRSKYEHISHYVSKLLDNANCKKVIDRLRPVVESHIVVEIEEQVAARHIEKSIGKKVVVYESEESDSEGYISESEESIGSEGEDSDSDGQESTLNADAIKASLKTVNGYKIYARNNAIFDKNIVIGILHHNNKTVLPLGSSTRKWCRKYGFKYIDKRYKGGIAKNC